MKRRGNGCKLSLNSTQAVGSALAFAELEFEILSFTQPYHQLSLNSIQAVGSALAFAELEFEMTMKRQSLSYIIRYACMPKEPCTGLFWR